MEDTEESVAVANESTYSQESVVSETGRDLSHIKGIFIATACLTAINFIGHIFCAFTCFQILRHQRDHQHKTIYIYLCLLTLLEILHQYSQCYTTLDNYKNRLEITEHGRQYSSIWWAKLTVYSSIFHQSLLHIVFSIRNWWLAAISCYRTFVLNSMQIRRPHGIAPRQFFQSTKVPIVFFVVFIITFTTINIFAMFRSSTFTLYFCDLNSGEVKTIFYLTSVENSSSWVPLHLIILVCQFPLPFTVVTITCFTSCRVLINRARYRRILITISFPSLSYLLFQAPHCIFNLVTMRNLFNNDNSTNRQGFHHLISSSVILFSNLDTFVNTFLYFGVDSNFRKHASRYPCSTEQNSIL